HRQVKRWSSANAYRCTRKPQHSEVYSKRRRQMVKLKIINKVLVANRGEIAIRVFRSCTELNRRTVAMYSQEDSGSLHRYKADEVYIIGEYKRPTDPYLDVEQINEIAKQVNVDAIHPGYGFLSENIEFAKRGEEEGLIF